MLDILEFMLEDNINPDEETNILCKQTDGSFLNFLFKKFKTQFVKTGIEMGQFFSQIAGQEENKESLVASNCATAQRGNCFFK